MPVRRVAVLVGSHDPTFFKHHEWPERPGEAAVLAALRAQRSTSEANRRPSASGARVADRRSIARRAGARFGAATRRGHARDPGGPPRPRPLAVAPVRPIPQARGLSLTRPLADV